jgi:hypothetical protein
MLRETRNMAEEIGSKQGEKIALKENAQTVDKYKKLKQIHHNWRILMLVVLIIST